MIQAFRPGATSISENLTAGVASVASTNAATAGCVLRVVNGAADIRVVVATVPVAVAASPKMLSNTTEYFLVGPGDKVAVIRDGATDSAVNISFLSR